RHAAAVEVEISPPARVPKSLMEGLSRVLLEVNTRDAHPPRHPAARVLDHPVGSERLLVLRNLVTLRQGRVEVILTRDDRRVVEGAAERQCRPYRIVHGGPIENRQRAGETETHRTYARIRLGAELGGAAAENFRLGQEVGVDFEPDDRFKLHESS